MTDEKKTARLIMATVTCVPGEAPVYEVPALSDFVEGYYPGQWIGKMAQGRKMVEVVVSPDRIGRCNSWHGLEKGKIQFGVHMWDFEENRDAVMEKLAEAAREKMTRYSDDIAVSVALLATPSAVPGI